ncbi:caspase family protein [Variovorax gossypii]
MSKTVYQVLGIRTRHRSVLRAVLSVAAVTCVAQPAAAQLKVGTSTGEMVVYEQSEALLIGASVYKNAAAWPKLTSVPTEVESVADALRLQGFKVTSLPNPSSEQLYQGMKNFLFQKMKAKSRAIVYLLSSMES